MSTDPTPNPPPFVKPPRSALTVRDMLVALGVLALVVLVIGGARGCAFSPGGPTVDRDGLPPADAPAELREIAPRVPFAVRIPAVPADWRANSVDRDRGPAGDLEIVRAGYLTPEGRYLRLLQSAASEEALLAVETTDAPLVAQGPVDVGGVGFVVYGAAPDEPVWIGELTTPDSEPVRVLITGSGTDEDFRAFADAVRSGEVLPVGTATG